MKVIATSFFKILLAIVLTSCSFIAEFDDEGPRVTGLKQDKLNIVFSHNINGETHPCGCRHFPLGGLPQIAGKFSEVKKSGDFIYVDTGDTFFASSKLPNSLQKSLTYSAKNLAKALDQLGLNYFVPGDQDFAGGLSFLQDIANNAKFNFLISNLKNPKTFKHKKWVQLEKGPNKIFLVGVVDGTTLPVQFQSLFNPIDKTLPNTMKELISAGYDEKNQFHRLIILSHSGVDEDEKLAKKYPQIDWIIGSHTQSFIRFPIPEGKTKIVQALSRNHYYGHITIDLKNNRSKDIYKIEEVREESSQLLKPNPFDDFILKHKAEVSRIQIEEQDAMIATNDGTTPKFNTATSCMECHTKQANHWNNTPHALAYITLINAKEENNMACIKCHSVGANDKRGFSRKKDMIIIEDEKKLSETGKLESIKKNYWNDLSKSFKNIKSVRSLKPNEIKKHSETWNKLDEKYNVKHNFANVQCLNCHDKHEDHPFHISESETLPTGVEKYKRMKNKCISCHDPDQSPEWYSKDDKGLARKINESIIKQKIKSVGCPKGESN
jgi:2',3'-cyclic-nucleotide 2'-phosphodiesterase (5'-nucleotidase family)